jgi:isoleucyl-tRNA synthetase
MTTRTQNYKATIHLPQTRFAMKADLPRREPRIRQRWEQMQLDEKLRQARRGRPRYVLHDGPPYANGDIHMGHLLNKVLKDVVVKYKTMRNYDSPFLPGWDCHGLPIEHKVLQELGPRALEVPRSQIRDRCQQYALKYVAIQRQQFKTLGIFGQWQRPYLTLDPSYEAGILDVFARLVEGGYVYRQLKSIHWCPTDQTALAEAELEYADRTSSSLYVNFPLEDSARKFFAGLGDEPLFLMIWTTTPWTLPANVAIALHPDYEYTAVRYTDPKTGQKVVTVMAAELVDRVLPLGGVTRYERLGSVQGQALHPLTYRHVLLDRTGRIVLADYVTLNEGTGCVHTAPGHGEEDYKTGVQYDLPILCPVDAAGRFTPAAGVCVGQNVFQANEPIVELLAQKGALFHSSTLTHSYPHCWRCKNPVIFRATDQWFLRVDDHQLRQRVLRGIRQVQWLPPWGQTRIESMVAERPDWCISRQRAWGVPIPAFYCQPHRHPLLTAELVRHIRDLVAQHGANIWFQKDAQELLPPGVRCPQCGSSHFDKESDILDVWFESGASHRSVCEAYPELGYPADMYLEGSDQHRGWFQSSILTAVAVNDRAPFRTVLTHGFIVDEQGQKMSKALGNVVDAVEAVQKFGADLLRLFVCSVDYHNDVKVSEAMIARMADVYFKIRNTFRYLLGNLGDYRDFDPQRHRVPYNQMPEIDRWALCRTRRLLEAVTRAYDRFEFFRVYQLVHQFCAVDLSGFYFDVLKDRLYCEAVDSPLRRSAQSVLDTILRVLTPVVAPILVHTAEEIWDYLPDGEKPPSVHLALWPLEETRQQGEPPLFSRRLDSQAFSPSGPLAVLPDDPALEERWCRLREVRDEVLRELERLRAAKQIGSNMQASVVLYTNHQPLRQLLEQYRDQLPTLLIVSEVILADVPPDLARQGLELTSLWAQAHPSPYPKSQRCWNYRPTVGTNPRWPDVCQRCATVLEATHS